MFQGVRALVRKNSKILLKLANEVCREQECCYINSFSLLVFMSMLLRFNIVKASRHYFNSTQYKLLEDH